SQEEQCHQADKCKTARTASWKKRPRTQDLFLSRPAPREPIQNRPIVVVTITIVVVIVAAAVVVVVVVLLSQGRQVHNGAQLVDVVWWCWGGVYQRRLEPLNICQSEMEGDGSAIFGGEIVMEAQLQRLEAVTVAVAVAS
ncbi:hypothetical protein CSUB01_11823, partial [Colletotrichum sublineola]